MSLTFLRHLLYRVGRLLRRVRVRDRRDSTLDHGGNRVQGGQRDENHNALVLPDSFPPTLTSSPSATTDVSSAGLDDAHCVVKYSPNLRRAPSQPDSLGNMKLGCPVRSPPGQNCNLKASQTMRVAQHTVVSGYNEESDESMPPSPDDPLPGDTSRTILRGVAIPASPSWKRSLKTRLAPTTSPGEKLRQAPLASPTSVVDGTSYFPYSHNVTIGKLMTNSGPPRTLFDYLNPHIAHGAAHDSNERCDAPACHEETRVAIREEIVGWIKRGDRDDEPKRIMWLSGPAGAGKSAIAGSVAVACKEEGLLAASFFFSSFSPSAYRSSKRGRLATLAYHMSQSAHLDEYKANLYTAIEDHPDIFHKNLKEQAECLVLGPFRLIHDPRDRAGWPKAIIIDGLDEVVGGQDDDPRGKRTPRSSEDDQVEILNVLLTLSQSPAFPFCIFVASRPERNIAEFFTDARATINLFLDDKYEPDADIRRFFKAKFAHIQRRAGISTPSWPGLPVLNRLVKMSSGQFVVSATIVRWIESGLPQRQLDDVLQLSWMDVGKKNPFAMLDALYCHILKRANNPDDDPHLVVMWIQCITSAMNPSWKETPARLWRQFLEDKEGELTYRLAPITSLIAVPPPDNASAPINIYHKSLADFLSSPSRCGELYVDKTVYNSFVANRILAILKHKGPNIPLRSPMALESFLNLIFCLDLLSHCVLPGPKYQEVSAKFLGFLSEDSKAELATCDVGWWASVLLSGHIPRDSGGHPHTFNGAATRNDAVTCTWLAGGIYCGIHKAMGCGLNAVLSSTQGATERGQDPQCHAACVRWRTGIMAKAKELGWCVHELEGMELDRLEYVKLAGPGKQFKRWASFSKMVLSLPALYVNRDSSPRAGNVQVA